MAADRSGSERERVEVFLLHFCHSFGWRVSAAFIARPPWLVAPKINFLVPFRAELAPGEEREGVIFGLTPDLLR